MPYVSAASIMTLALVLAVAGVRRAAALSTLGTQLRAQYSRNMADEVIIYGKDSCPYTLAARDDYRDRGVPFRYVNVKKDRRAWRRC